VGSMEESGAFERATEVSMPEAALAPLDDAFSFARVQEFNAYLCSTVHVAHAHRMRGERWADDPSAIAAMQRKVPQTVTACFDLIEHGMFLGPWVMGDAYTICDPYLFTLAQWWDADGVNSTRLPKLQDHGRRMRQRPAVVRALATEIT
jgi:glutathione S-transferase